MGLTDAMHIDLQERCVVIDGREFAFPLVLTDLDEVLGERDFVGNWKGYGLSAKIDFKAAEPSHTKQLTVHVSDAELSRSRPDQPFRGT